MNWGRGLQEVERIKSSTSALEETVLRRPLQCCYITTKTLQLVLGTVKKAVVLQESCCLSLSFPCQLMTRGEDRGFRGVKL